MAKKSKDELLQEALDDHGVEIDPEASYVDVLDQVRELRDAEDVEVESQEVPDEEPAPEPEPVSDSPTPSRRSRAERDYPFDRLGNYTRR